MLVWQTPATAAVKQLSQKKQTVLYFLSNISDRPIQNSSTL